MAARWERVATPPAAINLLILVKGTFFILAEAQGDKVLGAEFEHEDDTLAIELKVADAAGVVTERMVAADTGAVIPGDQDDGESEGGKLGEESNG